jgi:hypothetical protein
MNLTPPPDTEDPKKLKDWLNDLYDFLKYPVFPEAGIDSDVITTTDLTVEGPAVVQGAEGLDGYFYLYADQGDDNADQWRMYALAGSARYGVQTYNSGSWVTVFAITPTGIVASGAVKDEDNMSSDSATHLCTQQSIKAYADAISATTDACFSAPKATQSNIAVGSNVTLTWATEIFDTGADFASNTFTAPTTGYYQLNLMLYLSALDTAATGMNIRIVTSNRTYTRTIEPDQHFNADTISGFQISVVADMDASDTAYGQIYITGGAAQTDSSANTGYFSGYRVLA